MILNKRQTDGPQERKRKKLLRGMLRAACCACIALCALCAVTGCTSGEEPAVTPVEQEQTVIGLEVTRAGTNESLEGTIGTARMIVFGHSPGQPALYNDKLTGGQTAFNALVQGGMVDIFLIANEPADNSWNLDAVASRSDLESRLLNFSAYPVVADGNSLIPMVGIYENLYAMNDEVRRDGPGGALFLVQEVVRLYAKVTLTLTCEFVDASNNFLRDPVSIDHVAIKRLPKKSWMIPARYTETGAGAFFDGANKTVADADEHTRDAKGFEAVFSFYIPEYLVNDPDDISFRTYLFLEAFQTDYTTIRKTYKLYIGDGIAAGNDFMAGNTVTLRDLNITRNHHYRFKANLKFDTGRDLEVTAVEVEDWADGGSIIVDIK